MNSLQDLISKLQTIEEATDATTDRPSAGTLVGNTAPTVSPDNPFGPKTDPKIQAWEKLTPAQKKWIGGADPTDPIILARMKSALPNEPDPTKPQPPAPVQNQTQVAPVAGSDQKPAPATSNTDKDAKVKRFTELLTKAGVITAPTAAPAPAVKGNMDPTKGAVDYSPAASVSSGYGLKVKESISFKSRIGQLLSNSGALEGLSEAAPAASTLTKDEYSELSKLYGDLSTTYPDDPALSPLYAAYNKVSPVWSSAPGSDQKTAPTKKLTPVDPKVKQFQDEVRKLDPKSFPKYGPDGRMGSETQGEIAKHPDIAAKYGLKSGKEYSSPTIQPKTGSDQKPAPAASTAPAAPPAPSNTSDLYATLHAAVPSPKPGDLYWVNGQRYKYMQTRGTSSWREDNPIWTRTRITTSNQTNKYTGPDQANPIKSPEAPATSVATAPAAPNPGEAFQQDIARRKASMNSNLKVSEGTGFTDESLDRIVSLVHYR